MVNWFSLKSSRTMLCAIHRTKIIVALHFSKTFICKEHFTYIFSLFLFIYIHFSNFTQQKPLAQQCERGGVVWPVCLRESPPSTLSLYAGYYIAHLVAASAV
jgi:hypothetical protein